jgi:hypothetical protein
LSGDAREGPSAEVATGVAVTAIGVLDTARRVGRIAAAELEVVRAAIGLYLDLTGTVTLTIRVYVIHAALAGA